MNEPIPSHGPGRFTGRTVLVTGGTAGIGRAISLAAAREGARVLAVYGHDDATAEALEAEATAKGLTISTYRSDVASPSAVAALFARMDTLGHAPDVVIASHGVVRRGKLPDITEEMWDDVLDVNLKGVFLVCQAAAKRIPPGSKGSMVLVSSMRGVEGSASSAHYAASKAGVIALAKSLARELAPHIRVNCVAPGYVETRLQASLTPAQRAEICAATPLARIGSPEEIASAVLFLASDEASFITGQTLLADGGRVMA